MTDQAKTAEPPSIVKRCPICGKPANEEARPFCSKRCADVDLHRWLGGMYSVPVTADDEDDSFDHETDR